MSQPKYSDKNYNNTTWKIIFASLLFSKNYINTSKFDKW